MDVLIAALIAAAILMPLTFGAVYLFYVCEDWLHRHRPVAILLIVAIVVGMLFGPSLLIDLIQ